MKYLSLIEDYFVGTLSGKDLEYFFEELRKNSELKNEFEIYKKALEFSLSQEKKLSTDISRMRDFEFNPKLQLDSKKYGSSKPLNEDEELLSNILRFENIKRERQIIRKSIIVRWTKVAAVAIVLIGFSITGFLIGPKLFTNDDDLFNRFYSPYIHSNTSRSGTSNSNESVIEGLLYYDNGEYKKAILMLNSNPDSLLSNQELFIVEGVSYMELGSYKEALQKLNKINENSLLYTTSLWYQGLCYIKLKDNKNAREVFQKLKSYEPYYQKETRKLLRYL